MADVPRAALQRWSLRGAAFVLLTLSITCSYLLLRSSASTPPVQPYNPASSICVIYDGTRAEKSLVVLLINLLQLMASIHAEVTVLSVADGESAAAAPAELLPAATGSSAIRWISLQPTQHKYDASLAATLSFRVLEWLRDQSHSFDHIIFHAAGGTAYYPLLAREQGLALRDTSVTLLMIAPRQLQWRRHGGAGASIDELEEDHMQRHAASCSDAMIAPAASLRFMRGSGWRLPRLISTTAAWSPAGHGYVAADARFGERGSGQNLTTPRSMQPGRLPILRLWSGTAAVTRSRSLRQPESGSSAAWSSPGSPLAHVGAATARSQPAAPSEGGTGLRTSASGPSVPRWSRLGAAGVLVSVCIVHHERGPVLLQTLQSIRHQTLPAEYLQVVIVDDGSVSPPAVQTLYTLKTEWAEFSSGKWLLLERPPRYLGASRNEAARHAHGEFLYFLDDDNCLKPHALSSLVDIAILTGSHVLTSANEKWPSFDAPPVGSDDPITTERWLPLGDAAAVGVFRNCFGDASALVRLSAFRALGGFTEDANVGHEDWELWARAVLRGYKLQTVPEPLYWYRVAGGGMLSESIGAHGTAQAQRNMNYARNLRPYLERLAGWPEAQDALQLSQGLFLELQR